jgi:competence protein ComEC
LGIETGIPESVRQAFQATGTAHVIAISGFNISVLAGLFFRLFSRPLGRWRGAILSAVGIIFYTIQVGADPPVVRAAILGTLSLAAGQIGRRQTGINSLAFVAAVMALFDPNLPWDVGFQLSFAATLGLVLYAEPIMNLFTRLASRKLPQPVIEKISGPVGEYLLLTLAAQVTVFPVTAYHFRQLSLSMFTANPLILPAQPLVMILGGLAVLAGLASTSLGQLLAYLAWPFTAYTIRVVELFGRLPGGVIALGNLSLGFVIVYYALLFLGTFSWSKISGWLRSRLKSIGLAIPFVGLFLTAALIWRAGFQAPDGKLHLIVLNVGREGISGEGLLIQTPGGRYVLVNGGPSANRLSDALGRRLPMALRRLDALVVAGVQDGQLESLPSILPRYPPAMVLWAGPRDAGRAARSLVAATESQVIQLIQAEAGHALDLGEGARLEVLAAGKRGAVLLLEWQSFRALLPVGMGFEEMEALKYGKTVGRVTALLLADSGYAQLSPPEWIDNLRPQVVLLSVAAGDREGLPDAEAMKAVEGYTVLRTDRNGWIELTTDGEQMWVEVEKSPRR